MGIRTPFIAVLGATGNIGGQLVASLLRKGLSVRAIARTSENLTLAASRGAEPFAGDIQDTGFLTGALNGAGAAFVILPEHPSAAAFHADKRRSAECIARSLRTTHVPRVVAVSAVGAIHPGGIGPSKVNREFEEMLKAIPNLSSVVLRAAFLMENHLASIDLIRISGINGSPARADLAFPMVSTRDIALAAADILSDPGFTGQTFRELLGPRDYSYSDITGILGTAIGKPDLRYVQFPYEEFRRGAIATGISGELAAALVELYSALNDGTLQSLVQRNSGNTTSYTMERFARDVFAPAYRAR